ncbi:MAG: DUF790 family protein [Oligoflexus sp.]
MSTAQDKLEKFRPRFLDDRDEPWIVGLIEEYRRFAGKPAREWLERLQEPFPFYCPVSKLRIVLKALKDFVQERPRYPKKKIQDLRQALFFCSESESWPSAMNDLAAEIRTRREQILGRVKNSFLNEELASDQKLDSILFSDLASESLVPDVREDLSISEIMLIANTYLVKSIIQRSQQLEILMRGQIRPIVRQAQLRGLVCVVSPLQNDFKDEARLSLSGPLSIFRHARLYGRLLVEVLPFLPNCNQYCLTAIVPNGERLQAWTIRSGDPIKPAKCSIYDSKIEQRFTRDFLRATADFDLIREPHAIKAGRHLIFPDFAIKHRTNRRKVWLLEIVGYWTTTYLQKKIEGLKRSNIQNLIICVSKRLAASDDWPANARLVYFDRWIDPRAVIDLLG